MEQARDTKQLILDAAEHLIARRGFHGTSMRDITGMAGVNLAAANYHFGSKEALLEAVFERRLLPLNETRLKRLEDIRIKTIERGRRPSVRDIMLAVIEPTLRFREVGAGAENFVSLVGQSMAGQDSTVRSIFIRLIAPVFKAALVLLREALPEMPEDVLLWRLHFALGAVSHTMHVSTKTFYLELMNIDDDHIKKAHAACCLTETGTDKLIDMLVSFVTAGLKGP